MREEHIEVSQGCFRERLNLTFAQRSRSLPSWIAVTGALVIAITGFAQTPRLEVQQKGCSQSTLDRLESESDNIREWSKLRSFYHRYRACRIDDAEVGEGISDSIARMFANHWETLSTAETLFQRDPAFEKFARAGLNITDLTDDLDHIDSLAAKQCPSGLNTLCKKIRKAIRDNK